MARYWQRNDPTTMTATCERRQAEQLVSFDHHQVIVKDCWGILITYHWMSIEESPEPLTATVVFNPAPNHKMTEDQIRMMFRKHPIAPPNVQFIIDQLTFRIPEA